MNVNWRLAIVLAAKARPAKKRFRKRGIIEVVSSIATAPPAWLLGDFFGARIHLRKYSMVFYWTLSLTLEKRGAAV